VRYNRIIAPHYSSGNKRPGFVEGFRLLVEKIYATADMAIFLEIGQVGLDPAVIKLQHYSHHENRTLLYDYVRLAYGNGSA